MIANVWFVARAITVIPNNIVTIQKNNANIQYSDRLALPVKVAYLEKHDFTASLIVIPTISVSVVSFSLLVLLPGL